MADHAGYSIGANRAADGRPVRRISLDSTDSPSRQSGWRLAGAVAQRRDDSFWMALLGIVNILLGIRLWTGIPVSGLAIGFYVGACWWWRA